jgi:hypothetical protein
LEWKPFQIILFVWKFTVFAWFVSFKYMKGSLGKGVLIEY